MATCPTCGVKHADYVTCPPWTWNIIPAKEIRAVASGRFRLSQAARRWKRGS